MEENMVPMGDGVATQDMGLLDTVAQKVKMGQEQADTMLTKFNISKTALMEVGMYLGIGFVAGFIFKKYSSIFFTIILSAIGVWLLHYVGVVEVTVHWDKAQELFGIQQVVVPGGDIGATLLQWVTLHAKLVAGFTVGFVVGTRLG